MPNLYATPVELKAAIPDGVRSSVTKYDALMLSLLSEVSRWIDRECKRVFYPSVATRYFNGSGWPVLWVPDLLSITNVYYSDDDGATYTALTTNDYYATVAGDYNSPKSYTQLIINRNSATLSCWPTGQRSIKIVGVWGYADDRDNVWQSTGDTVQNNPLASGGTSLTVSDVDGYDIYGALVRFQGGQVLKIESEYLETSLTISTGSNTIGITRGVNGSTAAAHNQNTAISVWRAPEPVRDACIIQAVRQMERGFQGFGDGRATPETGGMFWFKSLDPEAARKLQHYAYPEIA